MLEESNIFWWSGMRKDTENKGSTCTTCKSSDKISKCHLSSNGKTKLPVLTKPGQEIQIDFSGTLHNKLVTGEPYNDIGTDRNGNRPVVWICKSIEAKDFIKILESSKFYGVPVETKSHRVSAFISEEDKVFSKMKKPRNKIQLNETTYKHGGG